MGVLSRWMIFGLALAAVFLLSGCSSSPETPVAPQPVPAEPDLPLSQTLVFGEDQELEITLDQYDFALEGGLRVGLTVQNQLGKDLFLAGPEGETGQLCVGLQVDGAPAQGFLWSMGVQANWIPCDAAHEIYLYFDVPAEWAEAELTFWLSFDSLARQVVFLLRS